MKSILQKKKHAGIVITILTVLIMLLILLAHHYLVDQTDNSSSTGDDNKINVIDVDANIINTTSTDITSVDGLRISEVYLGDSVDEQGLVNHQTNVFATGTEAIYATAYINLLNAGEVVAATLRINETGQTVGPAAAKIEQTAETVVSFAFYQPNLGWPAGEYTLTINLSDGEIEERQLVIK